MILPAGDILIQPLRMEDAQNLFEAVRESIAEVSPWLPWCHENYSIEETKQFIGSRVSSSANDEWYSFGIFEKETDRFLGGAGLNFLNRVHQMANLGYWVRTSAAGHGVASTGARLVAQFGFEQLGLHRIEIVAAVANIASQRVAEKVGAVREGVLRQRLFIHGQSHDAVLFSLVPEDLSQNRPRCFHLGINHPLPQVVLTGSFHLGINHSLPQVVLTCANLSPWPSFPANAISPASFFHTSKSKKVSLQTRCKATNATLRGCRVGRRKREN